MNAMKNKVQLIGNVGNEPEVKTLAKEKSSQYHYRYK
jgi:single-stranded DNA-binding protein